MVNKKASAKSMVSIVNVPPPPPEKHNYNIVRTHTALLGHIFLDIFGMSIKLFPLFISSPLFHSILTSLPGVKKVKLH